MLRLRKLHMKIMWRTLLGVCYMIDLCFGMLQAVGEVPHRLVEVAFNRTTFTLGIATAKLARHRVARSNLLPRRIESMLALLKDLRGAAKSAASSGRRWPCFTLHVASRNGQIAL